MSTLLYNVFMNNLSLQYVFSLAELLGRTAIDQDHKLPFMLLSYKYSSKEGTVVPNQLVNALRPGYLKEPSGENNEDNKMQRPKA